MIAAAMIACAAVTALFDSKNAAAQEPAKATPSEGIGEDAQTKYLPLPISVRRLPTLHVTTLPINSAGAKNQPPPQDSGGIAGVCPSVVVTHTDASFTGGTYILQGGLVETEIAAASFSVPANQFPIKLELGEMIFGTQNAAVQTTTQWSFLVWDGPPNTGIPVAEYSSDGTILPHIILPPGTSGINVQVSVDPDDPDQIFIYNKSGTDKFTIGYRIDQHHNPPTVSCQCVPGFPQFGTLPAVCCPAPPASNAFPASDNSSLSQPSNNWLYARACPGATGVCQGGEGWHTNAQVGINHDWVIRATYSPVNCVPGEGSCCLPSGTCLNALTAGECSAQGGNYQGDGTDCGTTNCPAPTGTCCINGNCSVITQPNCLAQGGTFVGGAACDANTCRGACCVPATQNCIFVTQPICNAGNGLFQGIGTLCAQIICFPIGACCLPDGSCIGGQSPSQCLAQTGAFQGHGSTCFPGLCPLPEGACCLGTFCVGPVTESDCEAGFGGVWVGANIPCGAQTCAERCEADIAPAGGDGNVNVDDLLMIINNWGPCPGCVADVNGDNNVNVDDLLMVINGWGPC